MTGQGNGVDHAFEQAIALESPTGARLNILHQPAGGSARAVLHINHGLAEHAARYARFAEALAAADIAVYAHDHRGHGATTAPDAPRASFSTNGPGTDLLMADIAAVHAHVRDAYPDRPLFLFGHSMGGLIAMNFALRHPERLAGAAVWNANFAAGPTIWLARAILAWERFRLGSDVASRLVPMLTFGAWSRAIGENRTGFDWLSSIPAEVDAYIADSLSGWDASVGMWRDVFTLSHTGTLLDDALPSARALPFHLVGGGADPSTNRGDAVRTQANRMRDAGFGDVSVQIFDEARHETLNDRDAQRATASLVTWIDRVIGAGGTATG